MVTRQSNSKMFFNINEVTVYLNTWGIVIVWTLTFGNQEYTIMEERDLAVFFRNARKMQIVLTGMISMLQLTKQQ